MHKMETELFSVVNNAENAKLMFETLEIGVDGVLIAPKSIEEILDLAKTLESTKGKLDLSVAKIVEIKEVGMGDRVCVDTCSILDIGEGLLVGSQSNFLFLVHGETIQAEFCDPRPFRVNAGPVHAYVSLPSGKTQYLSELHAGDEVLIVNAVGNTRSAIVGRAKIERRPLILVKAEYDGIVGKTLLQNAETIRLVSPDGSAISVSDLQVGDEVLVLNETERLLLAAGRRHAERNGRARPFQDPVDKSKEKYGDCCVRHDDAEHGLQPCAGNTQMHDRVEYGHRNQGRQHVHMPPPPFVLLASNIVSAGPPSRP